jgi:hypothetical protein|nr:MAG TPA: hypothetical protein [Caudoviricetes sp.]
MLLKDLMANYTPNESFTGEVMADDFVLAIKVSSTSEKVADYAVVQEHTEGIDSSLNSESNDKQYIRAGKSTTKKSTQRTFTITADRYEGDEAQDYMDSVKYKTGSDVITDYVYFSLKTGKGEKGKISIAVDKDGGGNAGDNAGFSATLSKNGAAPTAYTYADDST